MPVCFFPHHSVSWTPLQSSLTLRVSHSTDEHLHSFQYSVPISSSHHNNNYDTNYTTNLPPLGVPLIKRIIYLILGILRLASTSLLVKVLVTQSCLTLCDSMVCSLPSSSVHGILQARILEWVVISFLRGSSQLRDWTLVSSIAGKFFTDWATRGTQYWSLSNSLGLQWSFLGLRRNVIWEDGAWICELWLQEYTKV